MGRVVFAQLIGYALMWTSFPLLLIALAGIIEREGRIFGAIAVYNWLSALGLSLQGPIWVAAYFGLDMDWAITLGDIVVLFLSACLFFALRRLLEIRIELAVVLVIVEYVLSRILEAVTYGLTHATLF